MEMQMAALEGMEKALSWRYLPRDLKFITNQKVKGLVQKFII